MFPASAHIDKVQGMLVQILSNCSKFETFKATTGPSQGQPDNADGGPSSQDDGLFVSDPLFWNACVELAKTYERTDGNAHTGSLTTPTFDLGFCLAPPQSRETTNLKQVGSPQPLICVESELGSGPRTPIERSPQLEPESSGEGEHFVQVQLQRKKIPTARFRSPFFIRHIDVLKSLTIKEKQVSDWVFLELDEVHYER